MAERAADSGWEVDEPDESVLVTEDDAPLDGVYQEKAQRLLGSALHESWSGPPGAGEPRPFVAMANVGLFYNPDEPPLVPDVLLSVDVTLPRDLAPKKHRSYFVWRYGKPPDVVVEIVSNREGRELDEKLRTYERIRVAHYVVYDPFGRLGDVRVRAFALAGGGYVPRLDSRFEDLGLALVEWEGAFEGHHDRWLRWALANGEPIPTGAERAERERERAERERERAERERERAERLAARLRALGDALDDE
ncbi:MAG: Uma2 family endonuclease [Sandaracinaceae bacterium]|nr:Uma2 family endonuclease [Sandaracinaceae bacterium]